MLPTIYKVAKLGSGTLSVMAKPVAGEWMEDEFSGLRTFGVNHVVSLLESAEQSEVGLTDEEAFCLKNEMRYSSFPIPDRGLPNTIQAIKFAAQLCDRIRTGEHIVIHCRAGIGRTGIIAAAVLIQADYQPNSALQLISDARGVEVPDTDEQSRWVEQLVSHGA